MAILKINNLIFQKNNLKIKRIKVNQIEYIFIGDFYNILLDDKLYNLSNLKNLLEKYSIETIITNSIGSFFLIVKKKKLVRILNSFAFSGLYFIEKEKNFFFSTREFDLIKRLKSIKIHKEQFNFHINAHRQISYLPFNGIDQRIKRLPSGMSISFINSKKFNYDFYFLKNTYSYKKNFYSYNLILNKILKSYKRNINQRITLLFSGGLDSTVLFGKSIENDIKFQTLYFNRAMSLNICEMMVNFLSNKFKINSKILDQRSEILNQKNFLQNKKLISHYNIIGSTKELKYHDNYSNNRVYMSGQNADTLYCVDTFAPNTYSIKFNRLFAIIKTIHLRFFYTNIFLKIISNNIILKIFRINKKKFLKSKIINLIHAEKEHINWFYDEKKKNNKFYKHRQKYFYYPIIKILKIKDLSEIDHIKLYKIISSIKWFRFVINAHLYFNELGRYHKSKFITPFSEGPLVNYFSNNHVDLTETVSIKPFQKKIVKNTLGFNFLIKQVFLRLSVFYKKKYRLILKEKLMQNKNNLDLIDEILNKNIKKYKKFHKKKFNISKLNNAQKIRFINFLYFFQKFK